MHPVKFEFTGYNTESIESIALEAKKALSKYQISSFSLGCTFQKWLSEEGIQLLKKDFQPAIVKALERELKAKPNFEKPELEVLANFNQDLIFLNVRPVFVQGRYTKQSRELAQTLHYCFKCKGRGCEYCNRTGFLSKESVQQLVEKYAIPLFGAESAKFHGAGREDKDVRMLGSGREFVLELLQPQKRKISLKKLETEINKKEKGKIGVTELKMSSKKEVVRIKSEKNDKLYEALVSCKKKSDEKILLSLKGKELEVKQRTPERVKLSRANLERTRTAKIEEIELLKGKKFRIKILAGSGLYIKEFLSGDNDRTKPSISMLLENKCECIELDVLEIVPITPVRPQKTQKP